MAQFYIRENGEEVGPMTALVLKRMAETGRVTPETLVRKEGSEKWVSAAKVKGLAFEEPEAEPEPEQEPEPETAPEPVLEPELESEASLPPGFPEDFAGSDEPVSGVPEPVEDSPWESQQTVVTSLPPQDQDTALSIFSRQITEIFDFHSMATPLLIKICFALGLVSALTAWVLVPIYTYQDEGFSAAISQFVLITIFGPVAILAWRLVCEWGIILFKINENLVALRDELPNSRAWSSRRLTPGSANDGAGRVGEPGRYESVDSR